MMNNKIRNKPLYFKIEEIRPLKNNVVFNKFVNWVIGEFDLFVQEEEEKGLKVYFPNGSFSIECFQEIEFVLAIKVEGKSKVDCEKMMNQLMKIHRHVCDIYSNDEN